MMGEILIWHTPVSISFESHLKRHKEGIANLVFYYLGQPRVMEVCVTFFLVDEQLYFLIDGDDLVHHKEHLYYTKNAEIFHPMIASSLSQFVHEKSARGSPNKT
jgi:hypothetical protein